MVVQALGEVPAGAARHAGAGRAARRAGRAASAPADVVRLLELIAAALRAMKDGADARTQLELALVKAAEPELDPSVKALLARLERLEGRTPGAARRRRDSGRAAPTAAGRAATAAAAPSAGRAHRRRRSRRTSAPSPAARRRDAEPSTPAAQAVADARRGRRSRARDGAPTPVVTAVATSTRRCGRRSVGSSSRSDAIAAGWPRCSQERRPPPMLAAARRAASLDRTRAGAESAAFSKRKAEDPAQPRADRRGDPRGHRQLAARSPTSSRGDARAGRAPTLSEDELVERFMEEFDAEELPPDAEEQS